MKHWTIWLAVWLLIVGVFYFASRKTSPEKSTREIAAAANVASAAPNKSTKVATPATDLNVSFQQNAMLLTADQKAALTMSTFTIAQTNPATAIELALKYQLDNGRGDVVPNLMLLWAQRDFDSATRWAMTQPPGDQRDQIFGRLAFAQSQANPRAAAELVINEIPPGPAQQEAALSVLHQWMLQDFSAAKAWADEFPEGPFKQRVDAELAGGAAYLSASQPTPKN